MIILLFAILWGGLLTLLLCAPYSYYPLFSIIALVSVAAFLVCKKFYKPLKKFLLPVSLLLFIASYSLCSYIIFKPSAFSLPENSIISKNKKAVIFYCDGEMEKYTPYYANYFFEDKPLLLKPFYALNIKHIYRELELNTKNKDLLNVANEARDSLLNYKPYYFYIAFSGYFPNINNALQQAIKDGCSEITVLNYTTDSNLPENLSKRINFQSIADLGVKINWSKPLYESSLLVDLFTQRITNMPFKFDGIIILDEATNTSTSLKGSLIKNGYRDSQIIISKDSAVSIEEFKNKGAKSILYVSISDSSNGIKSEHDIPKEFNKYSRDLKITGIKGWGYDKLLVKAVIENILEAEKK